MHRMFALAPALAALAACHSQPAVKAENASMAEVAAVTKAAVKMQPGKWRTDVKVLSIDLPGLPDMIAKTIKQQMSAVGTQSVETCLTPEMANKPPESMFGGASKDCRYEKFSMAGGKLDGTLVCHGGPGGPAGEMRSTTAGTFGATSFDLTSDTQMAMPPMPGAAGGKMTTRTQVSGKRLGECAAKAG